VRFCDRYKERSDNHCADYGHGATIPCEGDTLEVGAANRAILREFFHLTTFVSDVLCGEIILIMITGRRSQCPFILPSALDVP
jgi:hypothetical protein